LNAILISDNIEILAIFEFSNGHFGEMAKNIGNFFCDFWSG